MGLFYEEQTPKASVADRLWAKQLYQSVITHSSLARRISLKAWAEEFRRLREIGCYSQEEIEAALDWFCSNIRSTYTPKLFSAKGFRAKFLNIKAVMERQEGKIMTEPLTPQAKELLDELLVLNWPKGSDKQLPRVLQASFKAFNIVLGELRELRIAWEEEGNSYSDALEHLLDILDHTYVEQWFRRVQRSIVNWTDWSGDLGSYEFRMGATEFHRWGQGVMEEYGMPRAWKYIMEALG